MISATLTAPENLLPYIQQTHFWSNYKTYLKSRLMLCVCAPRHLPEGLHSVLPAHPEAGGTNLPGHTRLLQPARAVQLPG